jgi:sugar phosphate isomerase/epimerase
MGRIRCAGREVDLSYSTNVHPAETLEQLQRVLREHVAPVSRAAFGPAAAAVNLRLGMKQVDELLGHPVLPSNSAIPDAVLAAPPTPACEELRAVLEQSALRLVSLNGFPIRDFHAPRVKEQVYSPPWTDGGRALYSLKLAKALTQLSPETAPPVSVPSGTFKGYSDGEEIKTQCAHFLTECARELVRLERLTGRTIRLGLEPEPHTTAETLDELLDYFAAYILPAARQKFPSQLGVSAKQAEELARKFVTVNLDLCHQAVEFEDPVEDLRRLSAAGVSVSGLHLSAALRLPEPAANREAYQQLLALDEPRYLHQVAARFRDGATVRFADLPDLERPPALRGRRLEDCEELRCHFHVPLCADFPGPLASTRRTVKPAARFAAERGLTANFVVETYTWGVLRDLAARGGAAAQTATAGAGDLNAGLARELEWAKAELKD